jgi:hypothetical protein
MFSKRGLDVAYIEASPSKKLKEGLSILFCENLISASRAAALFFDAASSDPKHVKKIMVKPGKNQHRDLLRKIRRTMTGNRWPNIYCKSEVLEP